MRKSPTEILNASNEERHNWLITATAEELYGFLRLIKTDNSWAQHGRDALSVALAKESMELQKEMKDMTDKMRKMTKWIMGLTIVIAFLTLIQAIPVTKSFFNTPCNSTKVISDSPQPTSNTNQNTSANQLKDNNDKTLNKTKIINHKETPNK